jgi:hypothetical protein
VGVWAKPTPPHMPGVFLAVAFFGSLLLSRSGSSMRKSFALCEGLRPHPLPPLRREAAADTAVSGGEALRSLHCAVRSAVQVPLRAAPRGEDLKEAGAEGPPPPSKPHPSPGLTPSCGGSHSPGEGSGVGVEDDHSRSACSRGAAVKLHVGITSRS